MITAPVDGEKLYRPSNQLMHSTPTMKAQASEKDVVFKLDDIWDFFEPKDENGRKRLNYISIQIDAFAVKVIEASNRRIETTEILWTEQKEVDGLKMRKIRRVVKIPMYLVMQTHWEAASSTS